MKSIRGVIATIQEYAGRFVWAGARHLLLSFLALAGVAVLIVGGVFLVIVFSLSHVEPDISSSATKFQEKTFLDVVDIWGERDLEVGAVKTRVYADLFRSR